MWRIAIFIRHICGEQKIVLDIADLKHQIYFHCEVIDGRPIKAKFTIQLFSHCSVSDMLRTLPVLLWRHSDNFCFLSQSCFSLLQWKRHTWKRTSRLTVIRDTVTTCLQRKASQNLAPKLLEKGLHSNHCEILKEFFPNNWEEIVRNLKFRNCKFRRDEKLEESSVRNLKIRSDNVETGTLRIRLWSSGK